MADAPHAHNRRELERRAQEEAAYWQEFAPDAFKSVVARAVRAIALRGDLVDEVGVSHGAAGTSVEVVGRDQRHWVRFALNAEGVPYIEWTPYDDETWLGIADA